MPPSLYSDQCSQNLIMYSHVHLVYPLTYAAVVTQHHNNLECTYRVSRLGR